MSLLLAVLLLGQTVGKVVSITDGDTIIIRPEQGASVTVRLIGIDAPERGQAFGTRARQALGDMIAGQVVEVIGTERDRYGRLLGDVRHDGRSINLELIRRGFAWAYVEYDPPAEYVEAEAEARAARRGLWSDRSPEPPWAYRRGQRAKQERHGKSTVNSRHFSPVPTLSKGSDFGSVSRLIRFRIRSDSVASLA